MSKLSLEERLFYAGKMRVFWAFKRANFPIPFGGNFKKILGCDANFFANHMRSKFKPGMNDENYGNHGWHIDHIFPLSRCSSLEELVMWCHYLNTQPLWESENIEKSDHIDDIHLIEEIRVKILSTQGIISGGANPHIDISDTHPRVGKKKQRQIDIANRMSEFDRFRYYRTLEERKKRRKGLL